MITNGIDVPQDLIHLNAAPLSPSPPRWVEELFDDRSPEQVEPDGDVRIRTAGTFAYLTICIRDAVRLDAASLREQVGVSYLAFSRTLARLNRHAIRFWNFIPGIGQPMASDTDRYMVFNAGRHDAQAGTRGPLATASAVGVIGSDLFIHCLAMEQPGAPIENPRQTPAWQYSARYGPLPPCFSRATLVTLQGRRHLLIGGTASVVGEDSLHAGDLHAQLDETLVNLESLVNTAAGDSPASGGGLARLVDLRVYLKEADQAEAVRRVVSQRCPRARALNIAAAQICRPELLVEIEGLAEL